MSVPRMSHETHLIAGLAGSYAIGDPISPLIGCSTSTASTAAEDDEAEAAGTGQGATVTASVRLGVVAGLLRERALAARSALRRAFALPAIIVSGSKGGGPVKSVRMLDT